ncbi:AcoA Pyruvate 2-oxoglutarate dehydrogenase, partial [Pyrenophora tritici-repentis]
SNRKFQHLWAEYKSLPKPRLRPKVRHNDIDDAINSFIEPAGLTENEEDEYEAWKRSEPIASEGVDPIKYWVGLRDRYPSLSKFAIDMLSIPGSSCECERLFSELGDLLEPRRRSISPQLLAAIQCDRRWIRAGFGSGEVPVKEAISDEEMDAKYGFLNELFADPLVQTFTKKVTVRQLLPFMAEECDLLSRKARARAAGRLDLDNISAFILNCYAYGLAGETYGFLRTVIEKLDTRDYTNYNAATMPFLHNIATAWATSTISDSPVYRKLLEHAIYSYLVKYVRYEPEASETSRAPVACYSGPSASPCKHCKVINAFLQHPERIRTVLQFSSHEFCNHICPKLEEICDDLDVKFRSAKGYKILALTKRNSCENSKKAYKHRRYMSNVHFGCFRQGVLEKVLGDRFDEITSMRYIVLEPEGLVKRMAGVYALQWAKEQERGMQEGEVTSPFDEINTDVPTNNLQSPLNPQFEDNKGNQYLYIVKADPRAGGAEQLFESTPPPQSTPTRPRTPASLTTMLSRTIRRSIASPFRRNVIAPAARPAFRSVTTDAASSHTDPANVPAEDDKPFEIRLSDESFETYELDPPPYTMQVTKKELKKMYYDMVAVRRMEMAADRLYKEKKIRGFCHLSTGQEAVAVGIEHAIERADHLITAYRCHGFALMRGATVKSIIGELLGRREGIAYGKGGSMHMFAPGFYGGNGIVGAQVPVGAGIAFACQYENKKNVTLALYGDGASNQGQVFEAFNMAKLWNLPVIFGCENNKYGMGTAANRSSALTDYYKRGQYIPGLKINGMDVLAVKAAVKYGKEYCAADKGPLVYEYVTYRYGGHSMSDPGTTYRTREEIQRMRSTNDPIAGLKQKLLDWGVTSEEELKSIDKQARSEVDAEVAEAEKMAAPEPTGKVLYEDIYVRGSEPEFLRGRIPEENFYYTEHDMGGEKKPVARTA